MPKPLPEYLTYFLSDCLGGDSSYTVKAMFGGYGIYKHNKIFALYALDVIYMKTHSNNLKDYITRQAKQFEYEKKDGKIFRMKYYALPEDVMENREELESWIEKALDY